MCRSIQHGVRAVAALAIAGLHLGCGSLMNDVAQRVTPTVVGGVAKAVADPETQRSLVAAVNEERIKTVTARLSAGVIDAVLDTLEDPARRERLEAIVNGLTAKAAGAAVDGVLPARVRNPLPARAAAHDRRGPAGPSPPYGAGGSGAN